MCKKQGYVFGHGGLCTYNWGEPERAPIIQVGYTIIQQAWHRDWESGTSKRKWVWLQWAKLVVDG